MGCQYEPLADGTGQNGNLAVAKMQGQVNGLEHHRGTPLMGHHLLSDGRAVPVFLPLVINHATFGGLY